MEFAIQGTSIARCVLALGHTPAGLAHRRCIGTACLLWPHTRRGEKAGTLKVPLALTDLQRPSSHQLALSGLSISDHASSSPSRLISLDPEAHPFWHLKRLNSGQGPGGTTASTDPHTSLSPSTLPRGTLSGGNLKGPQRAALAYLNAPNPHENSLPSSAQSGGSSDAGTATPSSAGSAALSSSSSNVLSTSGLRPSQPQQSPLRARCEMCVRVRVCVCDRESVCVREGEGGLFGVEKLYV